MKTNHTIPQPLLRKIVLTPLLGAFCLVLGIAAYLSANDRILLILSGVLFCSCIFKGVGHYRAAASGRYEVICGTCVRVSPQLMGKLRKITLIDEEGIETSLRLPKQHRIVIGVCYRFYFAKSSALQVGSDYLDTLLTTGSFLGYEQAEEQTENSFDKP